MKYIDIHAHVGISQLYPIQYLTGMLDNLQGANISQIENLARILLRDTNCEKFLRQMDMANIEKAVLLIIDGGIGLGEPEYSIEEIYNVHYKILKAHPDRFIVFAGIDPRRGEDGLAIFKKGIFDMGFKGLKLYPPMGFSISDEKMIPYFDICRQASIPVLIHTGPSLPTLKNEFADPAGYISTLEKYEDIQFILAHMGYQLTNPAVASLLKLKNVFLDITGFQKLDFSQPANMDKLKMIFEDNVNDKVLFGTDWPLFNFTKPITDHINILKQISSEKSFNKIMFENAYKLLHKTKDNL